MAPAMIDRREALGQRIKSIHTQLKTLRNTAADIMPAIYPEFTDAIAEIEDLQNAYHDAIVREA
jgi:hypothetical protein